MVRMYVFEYVCMYECNAVLVHLDAHIGAWLPELAVPLLPGRQMQITR